MQDEVTFEIIAGTYEEYLLGYIFSSEVSLLLSMLDS